MRDKKIIDPQEADIHGVDEALNWAKNESQCWVRTKDIPRHRWEKTTKIIAASPDCECSGIKGHGRDEKQHVFDDVI
jgi:hypothetical protein